MSKKNVRGVNVLVAAAVAAALSQVAGAAQQATPTDDALSEVVVYGIAYRNRTDDVEPVLSYDLEFFQRFEPSTAGDMLKRVPSAIFVSDVLEYDAVQLRGLAPGYTQVLINGKKVPGGGLDRSFWVDRIPAELVERVEILRSSSANRSGDAVAGALNIVLRDAYTFDGNYIRAGAMHYDDGKVQPTIGTVLSGDALGGRILFGANMQDRYNPKLKRSDRFDNPVDQEFDSAEDQTDTRDGQDYSANLSYDAQVGSTGRLKIDGFYVKTDREMTEVSTEYNAPTLADADEIADVPGFTKVDQDNWGLGIDYEFEAGGGKNAIDLDLASFQDQNEEYEDTIEYEVEDGVRVWQGTGAEASLFDIEDTDLALKLAHERKLGPAALELGVDLRSKKRDNLLTELEDSLDPDDGDLETDPIELEEDSVVDSRIKEKRIDPYLMFSGGTGALDWEAGLRYETTDIDIRADGNTLSGEVETASRDYARLLPSVHLSWKVGDDSRIRFSAARTVRRPQFDEMLPAQLDGGGEGDNDYYGNVDLKPETATGFDLGIERRLGNRGIVGVNVFYRRVQDLIEVVNTGFPSEDALEGIGDDVFGDEDWAGDFIEDYIDANPGATQFDALPDLIAAVEAEGAEFDPDSFLYSSQNVGKGKVYGVEFDLSTPLTLLGLPDTGFFLNYSLLDSEVRDFLGKRRFNNQARSLYNVGFIHGIPEWTASFGASYRKQGSAFSRVVGEEITTTYGADLELFVEKTFGDNLSLRLSGANLLDASKRENFHKFDNQGDQEGRDYDEYELERENAGPRYQLVVRWAF